MSDHKEEVDPKEVADTLAAIEKNIEETYEQVRRLLMRPNYYHLNAAERKLLLAMKRHFEEYREQKQTKIN